MATGRKTVMEKLIWHTEKRKIKDLIPTEGNPRQMTEKQARDLQTSLERFNLVDIPAINTDNRIISGHQRVAILKVLKRDGERIDVRVPNRKLTGGEHREYMIRANRNLGEWDYDLLANFDEELLKDIGWDSTELDQIFQLESEPTDNIPDIPEYLTFIVTSKQKKEIENRLDKCKGENRTEQLLWLVKQK